MTQDKKLQCVFLSPIITLSTLIIAILYAPWFNWETNALSDLGVSDVALIFNGGLIFAGLSNIIFSLYLIQAARRNVNMTFIGSLFFLNGFAAIGIGIIHTDYGIFHDFFAVSFFFLVLLLLISQGLGSIVDKKEGYFGIYSFCVAIFGLLVWVTNPFPGIAIPEAITGFLFGSWQILYSILLIRGQFKAKINL